MRFSVAVQDSLNLYEVGIKVNECETPVVRTPLLSGVAAGRPVSLEELRYFSPVGEEYRMKSASSNSLKTLRQISSSLRAVEGSIFYFRVVVIVESPYMVEFMSFYGL